MSKLNGKGPVNEGSGTGRGLGNCSKLTEKEKVERIGVGMGKRRKAGNTQIIKHK